MYRSGDLAYLQEDGNIQYCGRCDNQVKIHGQRMELEEIESVMLRCPDITNCAVIAKTTEDFFADTRNVLRKQIKNSSGNVKIIFAGFFASVYDPQSLYPYPSVAENHQWKS